MKPIILSTHPEHIENMLKGKKLYEFRRHVPETDTVFFYATKPVGKIIAKTTVKRIEDEVEALWEKTTRRGITKAFFNKYFEGKERGFAYQILNIEPFEQVIENPPQSYRYVKPNEIKGI